LRRILVGDHVRRDDFFLVENPIGRHSIGGRTPALR
jgi:hypothetical protein